MSGSKVVFVTGASSGIGLATALELLKAGYTVYGGARRVDPMAPIVEAGGKALALDVTDDASMVAAVEAIIAAAQADRGNLTYEAADTIYHLMVVLAALDMDWADVEAELARRQGVSGLDEKASRPKP